MANDSAGRVRLLFLMSWDFGELTNAIHFAHDPAFESLLLVPPATYAMHREALPVPGAPYRGLAEVLAAVERFRPEVVLLFSGYLFANNGLFTPDELAQLVRTLRARGCRVVTTDNFFGLAGEVGADTFNPRDTRAIRPHLFAATYGVLKDCPHLYNVHPRHFATTEVLLYCNRGMIRPPTRRTCPEEVRGALGLDPARPRWVFVLGGEDYQALKDERGLAFDELLTDQLYEALYQGRQPVLVAPQACTSAVALRSPPGDGLVLVPFCRHDWFLALMLDAEYAFYWNLFSNSLLMRVLNRLPVFFFGYGHMAGASAALFQRVAQCYYVGGVPPRLDFTQPVDVGQLALRAAEQAPALKAFSDQVLQPPPPVEVVRQLLQRAV